MKRILFITILALCCGLTTWAQNNPVSNHACGGKNHDVVGTTSGYVKAGITLTYDECSQTIFVNGITDNSSYLVTITSVSTFEEWYDVVSGCANVIDVSYLVEGRYSITLENNEGTTYTFTISVGSNSTSIFGGSLTPRGGEDWFNSIWPSLF